MFDLMILAPIGGRGCARLCVHSLPESNGSERGYRSDEEDRSFDPQRCQRLPEETVQG